MRSYRFYRVADPGAPFGRVAQLAEHSTLNRQVVGSIPTASTITLNQKFRVDHITSKHMTYEDTCLLREIGNYVKASSFCKFDSEEGAL
jgi:hypothetical protein